MRFSKEDLSLSKLNIRQKKLSGSAQIFLPEGSIDSTSAEDLRQKLTEVFEKDACHILIDMGSVKYLSSMGLGAIISLMHKAKELGTSFALYDTQVPVKRVLQISRLDFLELNPENLKSSDTFGEYILSEEPQRKKLRESRETEKNKREAELSKKK